MEKTGITLLGLGPGNPDLLTRAAWHLLENSRECWLRTIQHPVVSALPPGLHINSFDDLYESADNFEDLYSQIVDRILELGRRPEGVVYGVPGHPFIAEATSPEIYRRGKEQGMQVRVVEGLSFLEPVATALGLDLFPQTTLIDALELVNAHVPPFPPSAPAIISQIYSREVATGVKLSLMALYPDQHPVKLVHTAGTERELVESLALFEIDRSSQIGLLSTLYVPSLGSTTSFEGFQEVIAHLRAPDGCPWDREQTHQSLRADLLEETYEALAAIDADDPSAMREELGDLLLLIVMHAQIAAEYEEFTMSDILSGIHTKIVHRHPHVFGDTRVNNEQEVLLNWERMKAEERQTQGKEQAGLLDGVNLTLPALVQAYQYQDRVARVGFDWPEIEGVWEKLDEEQSELRSAADPHERIAEMGDLLFAVVNLARWYKIDPESTLREANNRFHERFVKIEVAARERGVELSEMSLDEMEEVWQAAKR